MDSLTKFRVGAETDNLIDVVSKLKQFNAESLIASSIVISVGTSTKEVFATIPINNMDEAKEINSILKTISVQVLKALDDRRLNVSNELSRINKVLIEK